jgi:hypothetical protein
LRGRWRERQDGRHYHQRYDGIGVILGDGLTEGGLVTHRREERAVQVRLQV